MCWFLVGCCGIKIVGWEANRKVTPVKDSQLQRRSVHLALRPLVSCGEGAFPRGCFDGCRGEEIFWRVFLGLEKPEERRQGTWEKEVFWWLVAWKEGQLRENRGWGVFAVRVEGWFEEGKRERGQLERAIFGLERRYLLEHFSLSLEGKKIKRNVELLN